MGALIEGGEAMNWEIFYLVCFVAGFAFTAISFLSGTLHIHLPGHGHFHWGHGAGHHGSSGSGFGFFNPLSLAIFLAWFGGTGYLLVHLRHVWVLAGLALSTVAGLVGAGIVIVFATKYFMANESELDPMDFDMVGVLGRVSGTIRGNGTGEIIFEQEGARRACAARSEMRDEMPRGEEVIVTRFENGVAYVRRWSDLAEKAGVLPEEEEKRS
jgi:membrane protein implicated in regulation of membrane protease activity